MKSYVKFKRWHRLVFCTVIIAAVICFSSFTCNSSAKGGNNNNMTAHFDYYVSGKAPSAPQPFNDKTAAEFVAGIRIGWSLGNTFDARDMTWLGSNPSVSDMEKGWVRLVTTKENIDDLKNAGFNAIRIPVSWMKAADKDYIIRQDWMDRITEVVNYAAANDMYIIIDTHHDEWDVFKFSNAGKAEGLNAYKIMWEQIAWNFKNYNDKLVFEGLNEPRTRNSPAEWTGGTTSERNIINEYYQVFVDTVRASGGNNGKRILMINPYGANAGQAALSGLKIPNDSVQNKIIVSIHAYVPYNFALAGQNSGSAVDKWSKENNSDIQAIRAPLDLAHTIFVSKGIPVIMGEFGAVDRDNEEVRAVWAEYYVSYAKSKGIPCFWWDNNLYQRSGDAELFGIYDRGENFFPFPEIIDALMRASR